MSVTDAARQMGKRGGPARARALTPARRSEIASLGAAMTNATRVSREEINVAAHAIAEYQGCSSCARVGIPEDTHCGACTEEARISIKAFLTFRAREAKRRQAK